MSTLKTTNVVELAGVRVTLEPPRMVSEGVGHYWFPDMAQFPRGELLLRVNRSPDSEGNLATSTSLFISSDGGETWDLSYDVAQAPAVIIARQDGALGGPIFHNYPDKEGPSRSLCTHYITVAEAGKRYRVEPWAVRIEGLPRDVAPSRHAGKWSRRWMNRFYFSGDVVTVAGRTLATAYVQFEGEDGYSLLLLASEDEGYNWSYVSMIGGVDAVAGAKQGPCEASMIQLADGDLMCVMRVGAGADQLLGRAYSGDGGRTWSALDQIPAFSVEPSLRRLQNEVLALSTGRPGIYLWLSTDPRGETWQSVDILAHHNAVMAADHHIQPRIPGESAAEAPDQTTAYTQLVEVSPNRLLLVYDRSPYGWKPTPQDSDERSRIYVLPIQVERT